MDTGSVQQGAAPDFDRRGPRVGERSPGVLLALPVKAEKHVEWHW